MMECSECKGYGATSWIVSMARPRHDASGMEVRDVIYEHICYKWYHAYDDANNLLNEGLPDGAELSIDGTLCNVCGGTGEVDAPDAHVMSRQPIAPGYGE